MQSRIQEEVACDLVLNFHTTAYSRKQSSYGEMWELGHDWTFRLMLWKFHDVIVGAGQKTSFTS